MFTQSGDIFDANLTAICFSHSTPLLKRNDKSVVFGALLTGKPADYHVVISASVCGPTNSSSPVRLSITKLFHKTTRPTNTFFFFFLKTFKYKELEV